MILQRKGAQAMEHREFLEQIGFSREMINRYEKLLPVEAQLAPLAQQYARGEISLEKALEEAAAAEGGYPYGRELALIVACAKACFPALARQHSQALTWNALRDITAKANECQARYGVLGTFVPTWFDGFFRGTRIALDRLQFDIRTNEELSVSFGSFTLQPGDFLLGCHIPSGSPLTAQARLRDYHRAWELFRPRLREGILPVVCYSWLLYPPQLPVYGAGSNLEDFCRDYFVFTQDEAEGFPDAWRVFSMDVPAELSCLPQNTRLQRSFRDYLARGGKCGWGYGLLLYDGARILTRR